jgi:hypothetical protein
MFYPSRIHPVYQQSLCLVVPRKTSQKFFPRIFLGVMGVWGLYNTHHKPPTNHGGKRVSTDRVGSFWSGYHRVTPTTNPTGGKPNKPFGGLVSITPFVLVCGWGGDITPPQPLNPTPLFVVCSGVWGNLDVSKSCFVTHWLSGKYKKYDKKIDKKLVNNNY